MASPDDELQRYIADLPPRMRDELAGVIEEEAEALSAAQRSRLQSLQQPPEETGALEESCRVEDGAHDLEKIVRAGGDMTESEIRTGSGVEFDYSLAFEYGTRRQPARSFFWSTIRERRDAMQKRISAAVERILG
jgi:hypothetical protein